MNVERQLSLTTRHGGIVSAEPAVFDWALRGDRGQVFGWEVLTFVGLDEFQIAIRTAHGFYVSAEPNANDWMLRADRITVQPWERFTPVEIGNYVALRTAHGRYVTVSGPEDGRVLRGDASDPADAERFGGGEVAAAPPEGSPENAFAPFGIGGWIFRTPLVATIRDLLGTSVRPSAEGHGSRSSAEGAAGRRLRDPFFGESGSPIWF